MRKWPAISGFLFPADHAQRLGLMRDLRYDLDPQWAIRLIETLERGLHPALPAKEIAEEAGGRREGACPRAIFNQGERTDLQSKKLSKMLSAITAKSTGSRHDMVYWEPGVKAIARITQRS